MGKNGSSNNFRVTVQFIALGLLKQNVLILEQLCLGLQEGRVVLPGIWRSKRSVKGSIRLVKGSIWHVREYKTYEREYTACERVYVL